MRKTSLFSHLHPEIRASPYEVSFLPLRGCSSTRVSSTFQVCAATESYLIVRSRLCDDALSASFICTPLKGVALSHVTRFFYKITSSQNLSSDFTYYKNKQSIPSLTLGISHP